MCNKSKRSKTISTIIRNHQYDVDGKGYRITIYGDSNIRYQSLSAPMRQSNVVDYRSFTLTSLGDCISASNREVLQHLHMSLTEHEETNSAPDGMFLETDAHVEVETDAHVEVETDAHVEVETVETEPESKPKSNKRKLLIGLGASTVLAGIITCVIKKN